MWQAQRACRRPISPRSPPTRPRPPSCASASRPSARARRFSSCATATAPAAARRSSRTPARRRSAAARATTSRCVWDTEVSRLHAELEHLGDEWTVERRRPVAQRLVRQRPADLRPPAAARRRRPARRAHADRLPRARARRVQPDRRRRQPRRAAGAERRPSARCSSRCAGPYKDTELATPATNQQIADELFLSVDAVKAHLRTLFGYFGVEHLPQNQKRSYLAMRALQDGVVVAPRPASRARENAHALHAVAAALVERASPTRASRVMSSANGLDAGLDRARRTSRVLGSMRMRRLASRGRHPHRAAADRDAGRLDAERDLPRAAGVLGLMRVIAPCRAPAATQTASSPTAIPFGRAADRGSSACCGCSRGSTRGPLEP